MPASPTQRRDMDALSVGGWVRGWMGSWVGAPSRRTKSTQRSDPTNVLPVRTANDATADASG